MKELDDFLSERPERTIDAPVRLDAETTAKLYKMPKKELIKELCSSVVEAKTYKLRCQIAIEDADKATKEVASLEEEAKRLRCFVEQSVRMIDAVTGIWQDR